MDMSESTVAKYRKRRILYEAGGLDMREEINLFTIGYFSVYLAKL